MLRRAIVALAAITIFMSVTALATPKTGCRKFNFIGTFLAHAPKDIFPDHTVTHDLAFQLSLSSDGTVNQYWTGLPDYLLNAGTGSPQIGSWSCRDDGKLVIVWLSASYFPETTADDPHIVSQDVVLIGHFRTTYLFSVDDDNTLKRIQSRTRSYDTDEDPTNPSGGLLGAINTETTTTYKRLTASDADLLAP
jgi:hypothetical protein